MTAIETVLSKTHMIDGQVLDVRRYIPPPPPKPVPKYDNKIFITGINQMTTKDGLENFLEAKAKAIPEEVIFGEEEGTALVTFEEPPGNGVWSLHLLNLFHCRYEIWCNYQIDQYSI